MLNLRQPSTRVAALAGIIIVLLSLWFQESTQPVAAALRERLEFLAYDLRLATSPVERTDDPVVIIDIDEKSLQAEGRWPWSRVRIGELVERLAAAGVAVIAFDVVFAEPERNPVNEVLQRLPADSAVRTQLGQYAHAIDADLRFAQSLTQTDTVLGFILHNQPSAPSGSLPDALQQVRDSDAAVIARMRSYTGNLSQLQDAAIGAGFLTTLPDSDGVIRRSPLLLQHGDALYPALALAAASTYLLIDKPGIEWARIGDIQAVEHILLGQQRIPTDAAGNVLVPYRGPPGSFSYIPATDVLNGRVESGQLENRIALVGASALALADLKASPVAGVFPGVEIQASLIAGLLQGHFPAAPAWARGADFAVLVTVGLILALLLPYLNAGALLLVTVLTLGAVIGVNVWLWQVHGLALALALPVVMILMLAMLNLAYGFLFESRSRRQLKGMFGQYVPPTLVEEMSRRPEHFGFDGESRELSVLFADIRGFTSISEALSAADLKDLLNRFFTPMTRVIFERRGTIDKYVGDMIMAFWGAPVADAHHASLAVAAALDMLREADNLKAEFAARGYPEVNIGIGINTGVMHVGDMGSEYRRAYTVLGDAVNLASRLEGLTKYYGVGLVVGPQTRAQADDYCYRRLDRVRVKGKREAVEVYEPVCLKSALTAALENELQELEAAQDQFWSQQWDAAQAAFSELQRTHPERSLYSLYLERIAQLRQHALPADWDGVYERREK